MSTQSFSPDIRNGEVLVILNTNKIVSKLFSRTNLFTDIDFEDRYIFEAIIRSTIQSLTYEEDTQLELAYCCLEAVEQHLGEISVYKYRAALKALEVFGEEVFGELKRLRLYRNGYLFYQFNQLLCNDIVLIRIVPPEIS